MFNISPEASFDQHKYEFSKLRTNIFSSDKITNSLFIKFCLYFTYGIILGMLLQLAIYLKKNNKYNLRFNCLNPIICGVKICYLSTGPPIIQWRGAPRPIIFYTVGDVAINTQNPKNEPPRIKTLDFRVKIVLIWESEIKIFDENREEIQRNFWAAILKWLSKIIGGS